MSNQSAKILVVDDAPDIVDIVQLYMKNAGYEVITASDGPSALRALRDEMPDLVVLDIMLPGVDGLEITKRVRMIDNTPIIMLTARREESDRVLGFELGADDYVVKPFSPQELVGRVKAVLRRTMNAASTESAGTSQEAKSQEIVLEHIRINQTTHAVQAYGKDLNLTPKEFELLWFLAKHPQQVFNRAQLLEQVWGETDYLDPSTVTVHIRRLRDKLEPDAANPRHIQTVWGVGYRFET
ncbi:MAG: response regulator transcription factor [Chloroflexota bacterium]